MTAPALFEVVAVRCFFGCDHLVRDTDPAAAHDAMERHYIARHRADLDRAVGWIKPGNG